MTALEVPPMFSQLNFFELTTAYLLMFPLFSCSPCVHGGQVGDGGGGGGSMGVLPEQLHEDLFSCSPCVHGGQEKPPQALRLRRSGEEGGRDTISCARFLQSPLSRHKTLVSREVLAEGEN